MVLPRAPALLPTVGITRLMLLLAGVAVGCETQPTHEVLTLTDINPRQVEPGDRVELLGSGFPLASDIRRITVRLSGNLARPGLAACPRPVQYVLTDPSSGERVTDPVTGLDRPATYTESAVHRISVDGSGRLTFVAGDELVRELSGCPGERFAPAPDAVPHATVALAGLRGGITVQIETVQGTVLASARALRGPVLDLHPPSSRRLAVELDARAAADRALTGLGLQLAGVQPPEGGLKIDRVRPGSPADEAGIADGDTLERIDGATLLTIGDFRPAPGAVQCVLSVRRGDALDDRVVRVDALSPGVPMDLVATGVLLAVALAVMALLLAPARGLLRGLLPGSVPGSVPGSSLGLVPYFTHLAAALPGRGGDLRRWTQPGAVLVLVACATTIAAAPLGPVLSLAAGGIDVGLVQALAVVALALASLAVRGRARSRRPVATAMRTLASLAAYQVPAVVALGGVVVTGGSLRLLGLVDAQGSYPWTWLAFRSPVTLVLCGVYLAGAAVPMGVRAGAAVDDRGWRPGWRPGWRTAWRAGRGAATFAMCALAAGVFLGGWRLPGVDPATQDGMPALQMLGAMGFAARTWGLLFLVRAARAGLARLPVDQSTALGWRYLLPTAAVGFTVLVGASALTDRVPASAGEIAGQVAAWTTFLVCALVVIRVAWQGRGRRAMDWTPDPFG